MTSQDSSQTGAGDSTYHIPVLCAQVLEFLVTDPSGFYIDGTVGGGGHAKQLCGMLNSKGELLCLDADDEALRAASLRLQGCPRAMFLRSNFRELRAQWRERGYRHPRGILLDLGVSSHQIDEADRGFSFRSDAPLDMRFDRRQHLTALDVVNGYEVNRLATVIFEYGQEHASRAIARRIVSLRPLHTTGDLTAAVSAVANSRYRTKSLARVFQAIRIEVNQELASLKTVLMEGAEMLEPGGRIAVIAYHSLEDRIVKETFRELAAVFAPSAKPLLPQTAVTPTLKVLTRHPLVPTDAESDANPRARSAKLRVAERV